MSSKLIQSIIVEALAEMRSCQTIISLKIKTNPYLHAQHPILTLQPKLETITKQAESLLLQRKAQPPLLTCNILANIMVTGSSISGLDDSVVLIRSMEKSQDWVNESIRSMNDEGIEDKEVRALIIGFRNSLEECTDNMSNELPQSYRSSLSSRIIDTLL